MSVRMDERYAGALALPEPTSLQTGGPTGTGRVIPVYTSDGRTVIGQVTVGGGATSTAP
jgi:hypothetical protein